MQSCESLSITEQSTLLQEIFMAPAGADAVTKRFVTVEAAGCGGSTCGGGSCVGPGGCGGYGVAEETLSGM